jgi:hypothetical protein
MRSKVFKTAAKAISGLASVGLAAMGIVALAPSASAATAVVNSITFKAPVHTSYDHTTGGGAFNDGSVTYSKGELLGTNYKCGDYASFVFELTLSGSPTMVAKGNGKYDTIVVLDYTAIGCRPSAGHHSFAPQDQLGRDCCARHRHRHQRIRWRLCASWLGHDNHGERHQRKSSAERRILYFWLNQPHHLHGDRPGTGEHDNRAQRRQNHV